MMIKIKGKHNKVITGYVLFAKETKQLFLSSI